MDTLLLALMLALPADTGKVQQKVHEDLNDRWIAEDKLKHFGMSFAITGFAFGAVQDKRVAVSASVAAGLLKEAYDKRHRRPFSGRDLFWDALGIAAGYAMIRQVR